MLWRQVKHGEPLEATIYEFRPDNHALITLTKMSDRHMRSVTTIPTSTNQATTFRSKLLQCDRGCIISQQSSERNLVASHLIPRRLGNAGVQSAMECFTGAFTPVDRYNSAIGVLLLATLHTFVDVYEVGFWKNGDAAISDIIFHALSH